MSEEADNSGVGVGPLRIVRRACGALAAGIADLIVPPVCLACHAPLAGHDALCAACWRQIVFIRHPLCDRLGIPLPYATGETTLSAAAIADPPPWQRARAVAVFQGVMRDLVHAFKYADRHDARRLFGRWMKEAGRELLADADLLVPVPLHRWRLMQRRFNQSAVLANELGRLAGVPVAPLALRRRRRTRSQVGLTKDQRRLNVAAAFQVPAGRRAALRERRIVLIDDVITSGATVAAATRVLLRAGAARVDVLALAMVTDDALIGV